MDLLQRLQSFWRRKGRRGKAGHGKEGVEERGESAEQVEGAVSRLLSFKLSCCNV